MNPATISERVASQLVLIDVQEKLSGVMPAAPLQELLRSCALLLQASRLLEVPVIYTEQYPKGLGATHADLGIWLDSGSRVEKICFSCYEEPAFRNKLHGDRSQILLAGMEAHICILQTALQLQTMGKQVFVVEDAVISRKPENKVNALARLRQAGVIVTNTESVVFEWLRVAEGDAFKQISRLVR
ncbi:MAG TPA: isochorismatase family protein [Methylophilaceae bacterium]|nr:isochorismatase family protein [Methylophilaceae bacterium]